MSDHGTPATEQVRLTFALSADDREGSDRKNVAIWEGIREVAYAEFDRWLAGVKAEAWDEGWVNCYYAEEDANPYRKETK